MPTKVKLCPVCVTDGGWHWSEDNPDAPPTRCPNILSAQLHEAALQLTKVQNSKAFEAAKQIIRDHAEIHAELSGNTTREAMQAAQIPSPTVGRAFTACAEEGVIENTGRTVRNEDEATRHRIYVWLSKRHPSYAAAHSSFVGHQKESA